MYKFDTRHSPPPPLLLNKNRNQICSYLLAGVISMYLYNYAVLQILLARKLDQGPAFVVSFQAQQVTRKKKEGSVDDVSCH